MRRLSMKKALIEELSQQETGSAMPKVEGFKFVRPPPPVRRLNLFTLCNVFSAIEKKTNKAQCSRDFTVWVYAYKTHVVTTSFVEIRFKMK